MGAEHSGRPSSEAAPRGRETSQAVPPLSATTWGNDFVQPGRPGFPGGRPSTLMAIVGIAVSWKVGAMSRMVDERPGAPKSPERHWWDRLLQALPAAAFLATFGLFFVDKNREARTVLASGRGLFTVGAIVAGYLAIAFVLRRFVRWAWAAPLVLTAVVVGLAAWIVRPYYVDETADRQLVTGPVQDASKTTAPATSQGQPPPPQTTAPATSQGQPLPPQAPTAGPVRISTGAIRGIGHDGSGTISIIRSPDGSQVVRFENFDIEGAPDPRVYLVEGNDVRAPGGVDMGRLQGERGSGP